MRHSRHVQGEMKLSLPVPSSGASPDPTCRTGGEFPPGRTVPWSPGLHHASKGSAGRAGECMTGESFVYLVGRLNRTHVRARPFPWHSHSFSASLWLCSLKNCHVESQPTAGSRKTGPLYSRGSLWEQISPVQMLFASLELDMVPGGSAACRKCFWRPGFRFLSGFWWVG